MKNHNYGAQIRAPYQQRNQLLEATRISGLPKLRLSGTAQNRTVRLNCVVCGASLETGAEFLQAIKVCRKCLGVYSQVDSAINARAEEKSRRAKLEQFARKMGGGK